MIGPGFLILTFILFLIVLVVVGYYAYQLYLLNLPPPNVPNPNSVVCNPDDVLQAWIQGTPNRPICPAFTNNYVIAGDEIQMFEKPFVVDSTNNCCYFSNEASSLKYFSNPWICIANTQNNNINEPFTLDELNQKPYGFNNNAVIFLVPPCQNNENNCVGLIRFGTSGQNALYKLFLFEGTSSNSLNPTPIPPNQTNFSQAGFQDFIFEVSPDCLTLIQVTIGGTTVATQTNGKIALTINPSLLPPFIVQTVEFFSNGRFYPIPGANPILSANAAGSGNT